ncbi:hypothetical protein PsYK624_084760 [Phanerochaete sordida]|uniref:Endopeptidase S2P n=1 Tax=Phanerochaete sordida TaxID=48140 RepID=A0A9P3LFS3_9APHY|nr:hypothetical protein PsYK624_084760 [Phanerochaete sordida]
MAALSLLTALAVFWLAVHAVHHVWARRHAARSVLPTLAALRRKRLDVTLRHAYLHLETARFNDLHDRVALRFARGRRALWQRAAHTFYNVGSAAGVLGMLVAIGLLCATAFWSLSSLWRPPATVPPPAPAFHKRSLNAPDFGAHPATGTHANAGDGPVQLLIPGVTLPMSHLPLLLLALFVCQVIHEAGHAITAAMEQVPLLGVGASLLVLLPSAHVSLPAAGLAALAPPARLRIIAAGAFHNIVLWLALASASQLGLGAALWSCVGYRDVGAYGRVVVAVEEGSPVQAALPVGAVILQIDDTPLTSTHSSQDLWSLYASRNSERQSTEHLRWCMDSAWFLGQPTSCCDAQDPMSSSACFVSDAVESHVPDRAQRCASTLEVLRPGLEVVKRCTAAADCAEGSVCIRPRGDQRIMRVDFTAPGRDDAHHTMVWSGPPEEFFEDVETSAYMPRYSFLPVWLPALIGTVMGYISTLTLSLFLFNLLPLPYLDGSQLLDALTDLAVSIPSDKQPDIELGTARASSPPRTPHWYPRAKRAAQLTLQLLLLLSLLSALWRAYG